MTISGNLHLFRNRTATKEAISLKIQAISIDGSQGEGGGQILRTALALSVLQGRSIRIENIRAGRAKPGLMRQHLACVKAAAAISGADTQGAELGSTQLSFHPQALVGGAQHFAIGTAGSALLVLQTILPALLKADQASRICIEGGTHNPMAPSACFIERCFVPAIARMGADVRLHTEQIGLFPAGGGRIVAQIAPSMLKPVHWIERGERQHIRAKAFLAGVPQHVATRELEVIQTRYRLQTDALETQNLGRQTGPGNVLTLAAQFADITELITAHGERRTSAEAVAERACAELDAYLDAGAVVGEHLSDQLLLPMWLAEGGSFTTAVCSEHLRTNASIINAFGGPQVTIKPSGAVFQIRVG